MTGVSLVLQRFLALTILVALLAGLWLFVAAPVAAKIELHRESIAQSRDLLVRYRRLAAGRTEIAKALDQARGARAATGRFLDGSSSEIVAAELQNDVKTMISASGGTLKSTQLLPHEDTEEWRRVTIRVNMSASIETTIAVFHAIETANPYLFLGNVQIRAPRSLTRRLKRTKVTAATGQLQVRYDVAGYMRVKAP